MLNISASMKEVLRRQNSTAVSRQVSPDSLLYVSTGNCRGALVDESGMIRKSDGDAQFIRNGRCAKVALCALFMEIKK
jgi:hypothetical protein